MCTHTCWWGDLAAGLQISPRGADRDENQRAQWERSLAALNALTMNYACWSIAHRQTPKSSQPARKRWILLNKMKQKGGKEKKGCYTEFAYGYFISLIGVCQQDGIDGEAFWCWLFKYIYYMCNLKGCCSVAFQIPPDSKLNKRISCKAVKTLHTAFRLNTVTKPWCGTHTLLMNEKHLIH